MSWMASSCRISASGLPIVEAIRRSTRLPLDLHLMIDRPERYIEAFVHAGADWITVHTEGATHLHRTLTQIRDLGARPGVTLNPGTPAGMLVEVLDLVDLVLVMTVNPGFGGQHFIESQMGKIAVLRAMLDEMEERRAALGGRRRGRGEYRPGGRGGRDADRGRVGDLQRRADGGGGGRRAARGGGGGAR